MWRPRWLDKFFLWAFCTHENIRCVHGDEINYRAGDRNVCVDCDRSSSYLPVVCSYTGKPHDGVAQV